MKTLQQVTEYLEKHAPNYEVPTRIVAEKVMRWVLLVQGFYRDVDLRGASSVKNITYTKRWRINEKGDLLSREFNPFSNLDDCAMVIDKLDELFKNKFVEALIDIFRFPQAFWFGPHEQRYRVNFYFINATALQRMTALFMAMPELMEGLE